MSAPSGNSFRDTRRHGFYGGPNPAHHLAPETIHESRPYGDRQSERIDRISHPNLNEFQFRGNPQSAQASSGAHEQQRHSESINSNGYQRYPPQDGPATYRQLPLRPRMEQGDTGPHADDMRALDALVAVATSEASTANGFRTFNSGVADKSQGSSALPNGNGPVTGPSLAGAENGRGWVPIPHEYDRNSWQKGYHGAAGRLGGQTSGV